MNSRQRSIRFQFAPRLEEAMEKAGKSKLDLAKALDVTSAYIHNVMAGRTVPSLIRVLQFGKALKMEEPEFVDLVMTYVKEDEEILAFCHNPISDVIIREVRGQSTKPALDARQAS